jgi:glycosyltransferase involved in cell wall biosynthesis
MWNGRTVSVVLPTYNEKDSIAETIRVFDKLGIVDDILVVNNNAALGTSEEVALTSAREVLEPRQGYGAAIRRGLAEVDTDLICICEPDGTFNPGDLMKLLPFTEECDFVIGSRTVSNFIWDGANMGWFLQWGNWAVAKIIEVLFNTSYLSDVGCTFRVISRSLVPALLSDARVDGSSFGLEMLLLAVVSRDSVVQVPVNYHPRIGTSAVTGDTRTAIRLGLEMLRMVLAMRLRPPRRQHRPVARGRQDQAVLQQPVGNSWVQWHNGALGRERADDDDALPDHDDQLDRSVGQLSMEP